jgi:hypothetical protein
MATRFPADIYYSYVAAAVTNPPPAHHHHFIHHPHTHPAAASTTTPAVNCGPLGVFCAIDNAKKFVSDTLGGASNDLQTRIQKGVVTTQNQLNSTGEAVSKIPGEIGKGLGGAGAAGTKALTDAVGGELNALQKQIGPYVPLILLGGGALLLIFLLKDGKVL